MKAIKLMKYLKKLEEEGADLREIEINFREDYDSDIVKISYINEDLFDKETNTKLTSISLMNNNK